MNIYNITQLTIIIIISSINVRDSELVSVITTERVDMLIVDDCGDLIC